MLGPRGGCLGYSKVYCDVRKRCFLAWNQNRHITYYIFHIQCTNSKISIGLLYIHPYFDWWHRFTLATSILVRASVSLLTFQTSTILAILWFTNFECCRFQKFFISCLAETSFMAWLDEAAEQHWTRFEQGSQ